MKKRFFIWILLCAIVGILSAQVGMVYEFEPVVILASRYNQSILDFPGQVTVIESEELRNLKACSIEEILDKVCGVDVRYRGPEGVQADPGLRGFSFNQVLVLVDGMQVNDPQTGHHNMDIPIDVSNIERIEVIKGGNSYINGANAFGGTINIVTKKGKKERYFFEGWLGTNRFRNVFSRLNLCRNSGSFLVSYRHKSSAGYIHNTDFNVEDVNLMGTGNVAGFDVSLTAGYQVKDFGANSFYSEKFKDQREDTRSFFTGFSLKKASVGRTFRMNLYRRYHYDHFLLDCTNPSFYENFHRKNTAGLEVEYLLTMRKAIVNASLRINGDRINSSRLGNHSRNFFGLILGSLVELSPNTSLNFSGYLSYYGRWGVRLWPGVSLSFKPGSWALLYFNANRSFRIPTYTELFYKSPVNLGNENLKPEDVWCFELGYRRIGNGWKIEVSTFYNRARDLIDWIRAEDTEPWRAENHRKINILGLEIVSGKKFDIMIPSEARINLLINNYYCERSASFQSKYTLNSARFRLNLEYQVSFSRSMMGNIVVRIFQRPDQNLSTLVDIAINKTAPFYLVGEMELFLKIDNIFDRIHYDYQGVQLPGRWVKFGVNYTLK